MEDLETDRLATVVVTINGETRTETVEPRTLLAYFIREKWGLTGTHVGCDTTSCGACTVLLNGVPVKSCTVLAGHAGVGRDVSARGTCYKRRVDHATYTRMFDQESQSRVL